MSITCPSCCHTPPHFPAATYRWLPQHLPRNTALHCTALHCTSLYCSALHCTFMHFTGMLYRLATRPVTEVLPYGTLQCAWPHTAARTPSSPPPPPPHTCRVTPGTPPPPTTPPLPSPGLTWPPAPCPPPGAGAAAGAWPSLPLSRCSKN